MTSIMPKIIRKLTGDIPPGVWNIDALVQSKYTPDIPLLFTRSAWWVFMYDDYKVEEEAQRVAFTNENYLLYRQKETNGLVALSATDKDETHSTRPSWAEPIRRAASFQSAPATRIKGTIHLLTPDRVISIDKDVGNTVEFQRRLITLLIPMREMVIMEDHYRTRSGKKIAPFFQLFVHRLNAWIWEGKREVFDPRIDSGYTYEPADIVSPKSLWIGDFYTKEKLR